MGIIRKQSIYSSIFSYLGFVVGAVNKLLIFPLFFSTTQIGLTTVAVDLGLVFAQVTRPESDAINCRNDISDESPKKCRQFLQLLVKGIS